MEEPRMEEPTAKEPKAGEHKVEEIKMEELRIEEWVDQLFEVHTEPQEPESTVMVDGVQYFLLPLKQVLHPIFPYSEMLIVVQPVFLRRMPDMRGPVLILSCLNSDIISKGWLQQELQKLANIDNVYNLVFKEKLLICCRVPRKVTMNPDAVDFLRSDPRQACRLVSYRNSPPAIGPYVYVPEASFDPKDKTGSLFYPFRIFEDTNDTLVISLKHWVLSNPDGYVFLKP